MKLKLPWHVKRVVESYRRVTSHHHPSQKPYPGFLFGVCGGGDICRKYYKKHNNLFICIFDTFLRVRHKFREKGSNTVTLHMDSVFPVSPSSILIGKPLCLK
jgi:hypothetical protein